MMALVIFGITVFVCNCIMVYEYFLPEPTIIQSVSSPDGNYVAYVYESNGGATTGFIYHLSILQKDKKLLKGGGNAYREEFEFQVEWKGDNELQVNNTSLAGIYYQKEKVNGIKINYKYLKK